MNTTNHPNRSKKSPAAARNPGSDEIKALRESRGLSTAALAELLHVTQRNIQQYECAAELSNHRRMPPAIWELMRLKLDAHDSFQLVQK